MHLAHIPIGEAAPDTVNVIIEIPRDSKNKYEYDEALGAIALDRVSYSAMAHPYDYGFISQTHSDDGDHLDAFVILDHSVFPGCVVAARPVGMIRMIDDGKADEKIICVPAKDPRYDYVTEMSQLSPHLPKEIQHFFEHYKDLQGKKTEITGFDGAAVAKETIRTAQAAYPKPTH